MPEANKQPPQEFPTTRWTLLRQGIADGTAIRAVALDELVQRYRQPLRAHLVVRKRLDEDLADELLQGFITEKFLEQYLLLHAERDKGRFRSLLVRSLENYHVDWLRKQAVCPVVGVEAILVEAPADLEDVSAAFDVVWARQLLAEVLTEMRTDCEAASQSEIWGVFECRLLTPVYERSEPVPYDEVCRRFGFASPEQASNALVTAKRKFQRTFERVSVQYQHDGEKAEDVLRELSEILAKAGPLEWANAPGSVSPGCSSIAEFVPALDDTQAAEMAQLLHGTANADSLWVHTDLYGMMRHQLAQRLADLDADVAKSLTNGVVETTGGQLLTLADLYRHPRPPLDLLQAVKRYGRRRVRRPDALLPDEVASTLYFASIAAALLRHGTRISTSDDEVLRFGFERAIEQPWMEGELVELFVQAISQLGPPSMLA